MKQLILALLFASTGLAQNGILSADADDFLSSANFAAMRSKLTLVPGANVMAYDADLALFGAITPSANTQALLGASTYAGWRALLDLEPGTDFLTVSAIAAAYQAKSAALDAVATKTPTSYGLTLLELADAAAFRTAGGLGTLATQSGTFSGSSSGTNTGDQDLSSYATAAAVASGYQPLNAKLTAVSGLAHAAGLLTNDGSGGLSWSAAGGTGTVTSIAITSPAGITVGNSPITTNGAISLTLDADLVSLAALTTTTFGRSLLEAADAAGLRTAAGLGTLATQSGTFSGTSSGTNTGDETGAGIRTKLGISTLSGSNTGDQTTITGNAGTATALQTARTINGTSFDGSGNITVTAAAGTLTGSTLAAGVTASSLTSTGTLASLTVTAPIVGSVTGSAATVTDIGNLTGIVTSTNRGTTIADAALTWAKIGTGKPTTLAGYGIADAITAAAAAAAYQPLDSDLTSFAAKTAPAGAVVGTTDTQTLSGKTLTAPTVTDYTESVVTIGTVTTTSTLSLASGTVQTATLTASTGCTFTMPAAVAGKSFVLLLKQAATTGLGTATFTSVKWSGGTAPTITATAAKMDVLTFISDGTNWYGSFLQNFTP